MQQLKIPKISIRTKTTAYQLSKNTQTTRRRKYYHYTFQHSFSHNQRCFNNLNSKKNNIEQFLIGMFISLFSVFICITFRRRSDREENAREFASAVRFRHRYRVCKRRVAEMLPRIRSKYLSTERPQNTAHSTVGQMILNTNTKWIMIT